LSGFIARQTPIVRRSYHAGLITNLDTKTIALWRSAAVYTLKVCHEKSRNKATRLEINTIQPIPFDSRHGRARDLFTVWFGTNLHLLTIVTGGLAGHRISIALRSGHQ
jgi:hypothetical protein